MEKPITFFKKPLDKPLIVWYIITMKDQKKEGLRLKREAEGLTKAQLPIVHEGSFLGITTEELVRKHKNTPLMPNDDLQLGCG